LLVTLDEVMHGALRSLSLRTVDPGTGQSETHSFQVRIPAGATDGRRIRVPGKGEPGHRGAPAGDLYLRVRFAAHPDFQARGADLYCEVDLAPWEAVLGTTVVAPSFEGAIKVKIPPATQDDAQMRVRGHGLPKGRSGERGDLYVVTKIRIPTHPSEDEKKQWEELARTSSFKPRDRA
jgi:curved DNA-binding protein